MKNNNKEIKLGIDEKKTHYYESNSPTTPNYEPKGELVKTHYYEYGWICPKCGAVMAPNQRTCIYCTPIFDVKITF